MGKSSSMAYFAMKWVKDETGGEYTHKIIANTTILIVAVGTPVL